MPDFDESDGDAASGRQSHLSRKEYNSTVYAFALPYLGGTCGKIVVNVSHRLGEAIALLLVCLLSCPALVV